MPTFSQFSDWKKQLLDRHGITSPDGRSLYLYRLTEDDFSNLEGLLQHWLSQLLPRYGLARVAGLSGFAELFVLYAAEWWRRRYDGSGFSWEPILHDLGADPKEWSPTQRSEFVRQGFRGWRIRPRESGGMRFIGSVAVQGGLPLKLLASSRGRIGQLLSRVLHLASGSQVTQSDLQSWVESLASTLPQSYRQGTIYTLLADVAWAVLALKQEAGLQSSADAVAILDQKISRWRERFPLPVEDNHAQGMIEQLIRDAASVRIEKQAALLPVERLLESTVDDEWVLRSSLDLPDVISTDELASLFSVDLQELPRSAELSLRVGSAALTTGMRSLAGQQKYRLERKPWGFADNAATGEHLLRMTSPDGRVWTVTASWGDELDAGLPWVFVEKDSIVHFVRQGSGSVAAQQALIALPESWEIEHDGDSVITEMGTLCGLERHLVAVRGVLRAHDGSGLTFRLRTGRADASEESYVWGGDRYWLDFLSPNLAFRGMPSLYRVGEDEVRRKMEGQPGVSVIGGSAVSHSVSGPLTLRYPASGDVRYRSKVLVLPKSANVEFSPRDAVSGTVRFIDWGIAQVRVTTEGIEQSLKLTDGNAMLDVAVQADQRAPDLIELEAYWPHSTVPARFRLPFPAHGVRVFDGEGRSLTDNSLLAVQQLQGVRILVSGGQANCRAEMEIMDSVGKNTRKYPLRNLPGALSMEIRLQDYLSDIQQLFSVSDLPDARITIQISVQGALMFTLLLARYSATLERHGDSILLDTKGLRSQQIQDLERLSVLAVRLESPGDEAVTLEPFLSEGVATGGWLFSLQMRSPGSWLVYPAAGSKLPFRPTLWFIGGEISEAEGLSGAFTIANQQAREQRIDESIEALASDYLNEDWEKVEQLAGQVGHLPLPTLDIWRRLARSPRGMAALALRLSSLKPQFITRFSQELPFAWETIALEDWQVAMRQLEAQCGALFGEQSGPSVLRPHLSGRIQLLTSLNGSLAFLLGIAATELLPDTKREVAALKYLGQQAKRILFEGENSKLMALRRLHADDQWPNDLPALWSSIGLDPQVESYLHTGTEGFRTWVINIPIILAVQAVTGKTIDWFHHAERIHALRNYQAFDPDWFEEAYNQTVAHCFADGLLDETTTL